MTGEGAVLLTIGQGNACARRLEYACCAAGVVGQPDASRYHRRPA